MERKKKRKRRKREERRETKRKPLAEAEAGGISRCLVLPARFVSHHLVYIFITSISTHPLGFCVRSTCPSTQRAPSPLDLAASISSPGFKTVWRRDRVSGASVYAPYRHSFVYLKFRQILGNLVRCAKGTQRRIRSIAEQTFATPSVHAWTISLPVSSRVWWRWPAGGGCDGGSEASTKHTSRRVVWMWMWMWVSVWVARPVGGARLALGWRVRRRVQAKLHY